MDYLEKIVFLSGKSLTNMLRSEGKKFEIFFKDFFIPVCRFIGSYTGEEEESADIAQEVFVKVYEKWNEFDRVENAKAFLYTVSRNLCLNHLKHKKAQNNYIDQFDREEMVDELSFLKEVTRQETFRILYAAVEQLPFKSRQVVSLCLKGYNNLEIADQLEVSINTIKTLKKNSYATLRTLLAREYLVFLFILLEKF